MNTIDNFSSTSPIIFNITTIFFAFVSYQYIARIYTYVFFFPQIFGIIFACCLAKKIKEWKDRQATLAW